MIHARSDGNDVLPVVQRTFAGGVSAGGNHRTVSTKGYGMAVPGGHGHHIGPVLHLALAIGAVPGGDDGAVLPNPDGVVLPGGDGHNVRPGFHVALAKLVVSGGQNGVILPEGHSVQAAWRAIFCSNGSLIPQRSQYFAWSRRTPPQWGQIRSTFVPHISQNRAPGRSSTPQALHFAMANSSLP